MKTLKVGIAQTAPVWLNKKATTERVISYIKKAAKKNCGLIVFGETFLPGYPFWIERTNGANFNDPIQKEIYAHYVSQAICIENGDLKDIQEVCKDKNISTVLGIVERPLERGGHSVYCTAVYINNQGEIGSAHRKLMPTHEERLCWSIGDGNGLRTHPIGPFTLGALNCWENWMPLARTSLYAQGENLHVAIWPGGMHNTPDITRFIALESRSFVISVCGLLHKKDITSDIPHHKRIKKGSEGWISNGGSCIAAPDGSWIIEPQAEKEKLFTATLDYGHVLRERHNFDPTGHYSRPDVLQLQLDTKRQTNLKFKS